MWDADQQAIVYTNASRSDATPIAIQDGDIVSIGGVLGFPFGDVDPVWLADPAEKCPETRLFVSGARLPD